jgi:uncharacterized protein (TIGR02611 family)
VKRIVVGVLGAVLTLAGVALLVLPGPGFVLVAAGLAILATQFEWARRPLDSAKDRAKQGLDEVARSKFRAGLAIAGAASLLVVGVLDFAGVDLPLVNALSAVLLIASGLFLVGTVIYAWRSENYPRSRERR